MIFYGAFSVVGAMVVPGQEWFWPSKLWWQDFNSGKMLLVTDSLKAYYLLYAARYSQGEGRTRPLQLRLPAAAVLSRPNSSPSLISRNMIGWFGR